MCLIEKEGVERGNEEREGANSAKREEVVQEREERERDQRERHLE